MGLGRRRRERQEAFWVSAEELGRGPRNVFYDRLNQLLAEIDFRSPSGSGRLPMEVHTLAFELVLAAAQDHGLLRGKTIGVDVTDLEANASMKSIVRRDSGEDWREYVRKLYEAQTGVSDPDDEELRRFDKRRTNKQVSNDDWVSQSDPESRIGKMKDGRTHLKYKAEHAVDLGIEIIQGDHPGGRSLSRRQRRCADD